MSTRRLSPLILPHVLLSPLLLVTLVNLFILRIFTQQKWKTGCLWSRCVGSTSFNPNRRVRMSTWYSPLSVTDEMGGLIRVYTPPPPPVQTALTALNGDWLLLAGPNWWLHKANRSEGVMRTLSSPLLLESLVYLWRWVYIIVFVV